MPIGPRTRKALILLGSLFFVVLLLVTSLPLWLPWLVKPLAGRFGLSYRTYERAGYSRFVLKGVTILQPGLVITADRIEAFTPSAWAWRIFVHRSKEPRDYLSVHQWQFKSQERAEKKPAKSTYELIEQLESLSAKLNRFLPKATFADGTVWVAADPVLVPKAIWQEGQLRAEVVTPKFQQRMLATADMRDQPAIRIDLPDLEMLTDVHICRSDTALAVKGDLAWLTNRIDLSAEFGREGRLPARAEVRASAFRVPANQLKREGYEDLTGNFGVHWENGEFDLSLFAHANPQSIQSEKLPGVDATIKAHGNTNRVRIETLRVSAPWLHAELSQNAELSFSGQMLSTQAMLRAHADLSKQSWVEANGELDAQVVVMPSTDRFPAADLSVTGTNINAFGLRSERLEVQAGLAWPWINVSRTELQFSDRAFLRASADLNLTNRLLTNAVVSMNGPVFVERLPASVQFEDLALELTAHGPLTNVSHTGRAALQKVAITNVAPMDLQVEWHGEQLSLDQFDAALLAGKTRVQLQGAGRFQTNGTTLSLRTLAVSKNDEPVLELREPARILFVGPAKGAEWRIDMSPIQLQGSAGDVSLAASIDWPLQGRFSSSIENLGSQLLADLVINSLPSIDVQHFNFSGAWTNEPLRFELSSAVRVQGDEAGVYSFHAGTHGDARGVQLDRMSVAAGEETILFGKGFVPVAVVPANAAQPFLLRTNQPFRFEAQTAPNDPFWNRIAGLTGLSLKGPRIDVRVDGTLLEPTGSVHVNVDEVQYKKVRTDQPLPSLRELQAAIELNRSRVQLKRLSVAVEEQLIQAHGEIPLGTNYSSWRRAVQLDKAAGHVSITNAEIAKLAGFFPKLLSPQGRLDLDLTVHPGKRLEGSLIVENAATRPMMPLGGLNEIAAHLKFFGSRIQIERIRALLGGEPIALSGGIDLEKQFENGMPLVELMVRGVNVPLVRSPDIILRSDVDLKISNATNGLPVVSGTVQLRDSFLMRDLQDLVPGRVTAPKRRPPYFSVEADPLRSWRLNVNVRGDNFLRVRTPVFRGQVSTHLKIEGTLSEPVALGDVTINSGRVQFPFATLRVRQGLVSLTSENPYRPQLFVIAGDRVFGYDIRVEVSGPADQPVIEFSSTPGLTSEQIVLLLTTGKLPTDQPGLGQQQRATRIGLFFGRNLLSKFGAGEGSAERLTVRTGENLSEQGKQTYSAEYKLSDRWSIVGEYDRFNAFNLGLKCRIYSK